MTPHRLRVARLLTRASWFCLVVLMSGCTLELETTTGEVEELMPGEPEKPLTAPRKGGHPHPCAGAGDLDSDHPFHAPAECVMVPPLSTGRPDPTDGLDPVDDAVLPGEDLE